MNGGSDFLAVDVVRQLVAMLIVCVSKLATQIVQLLVLVLVLELVLATSRQPSLATFTLQTSFLSPGAAISITYSFESSFMFTAGVVALNFVIHSSLLNMSSNNVGNQFLLITGNIILNLRVYCLVLNSA